MTLEEKVEFLENVLAKVPAILYINDLKSRSNIWHTKRAFEILGYTPEEMIQGGLEFFRTIYHPDDYEVHEQSARFFEEHPDGMEKLVYRIKDKAGEWHWFYSVGISFSEQEDGSCRDVIGVGIDLSEDIGSETQLMVLLAENARLQNQLELKKLSPRQVEVLTLIARGMKDKHIAKELNIAPTTAKTHRRNLLKALGVNSSAALVAFAIRCGLV